MTVFKFLNRSNLSKQFYLILFFILIKCSTPGKSNWVDQIFPEKSVSISFAAVGDIMVHSSQLEANYDRTNKTYNFNQSFEFINSYFEGNTINFANLETTLPGDPNLYKGYPNFGSPAELASAIKNSHFNVVSTANNHSADHGAIGLENTIEFLQEKDINPIGTYKSVDDYEKRKDFIFYIDGYKIFFYNYTYSTNGMPVPDGFTVRMLDKTTIESDLTRARSMGADCIIVGFHYGSEYMRKPTDEQKDWVDFAIHQGADIILGGHPHVLQEFAHFKREDKYGSIKERLVIYSMGNFISGQRYPHTDGGAIFKWNLNLQKSFSNNSNSSTNFQNIHYIPTWVFPNIKGKTNHYAILPVMRYFDKDLKEKKEINHPLPLDPQSKKAMKFFLKSTIELLGESFYDF
jgi:poly-gamma-glutamate capsule biosynthesis protein CapA/YwtB (metallophosphatase superfamily)